MRVHRHAGRFLVFFGWTLLIFTACSPEKANHSELFKQVVKPEAGGLFRGVDLGMKLDTVKQIEGANPRHDDRYGYVYEFDLGNGQEFFLEYISKNQQLRVVNSIVGNVFLKDEGEASQIYKELEAYWRASYGVAEGEMGELHWKHAEAGLYLSLRILEDKQSISFNFVPSSGF